MKGVEDEKTMKWLFVDAFVKVDEARGRKSKGERSCLQSQGLKDKTKDTVLCKEEQKFRSKIPEKFTTLRKVINTVASIIGRYTSPDFDSFSNHACLCRMYVITVLRDAETDFITSSDKSMIRVLLNYFEEESFKCCGVQVDYNYTSRPHALSCRDFYKPVDVDFVTNLCQEISAAFATPEESRVQFVEGLSSIALLLFSSHGGYAPYKSFHSPVERRFEWFTDWYEEFTSEMIKCGFQDGGRAIYFTAAFFQDLMTESTFEPAGQDPYSTPRRQKRVWSDTDCASQSTTAPHTPEHGLHFRYNYLPVLP